MAKKCAFCLPGPVCTALSRLRLEKTLKRVGRAEPSTSPGDSSPGDSSLDCTGPLMPKGSEQGTSQRTEERIGKDTSVTKGQPEHLNNIHLALALAAEAEREPHILVLFIC